VAPVRRHQVPGGGTLHRRVEGGVGRRIAAMGAQRLDGGGKGADAFPAGGHRSHRHCGSPPRSGDSRRRRVRSQTGDGLVATGRPGRADGVRARRARCAAGSGGRPRPRARGDGAVRRRCATLRRAPGAGAGADPGPAPSRRRRPRRLSARLGLAPPPRGGPVRADGGARSVATVAPGAGSGSVWVGRGRLTVAGD